MFQRLLPQPLLILLICLLLVGVTFLHSVQNLFSVWLVFDESYGHGILVAVISFFLCFRVLQKYPATRSRPGWYAVLPLLLCSLFLELSVLVGIEIVQYLMLPAILFFAFYLVAGKQLAVQIIVPILMLYFAVPIWDYLTNGLVNLTATIVQSLVGLSGITAFISGNSIYIPSGIIIIASGCSGLRYFIIGTYLGVLGSYLDKLTISKLVPLISIFVFLSLLANWLRVYIITLIAYYTEMQSPMVEDHEMMGWILFICFMIPAFYFSNLIQRTENRRSSDEMIVIDTIEYGDLSDTHHAHRTVMALIVLFLSISSSSFVFDYYSNIQPGEEVAPELPTISMQTIQGRQHVPGLNEWQPAFSKPDNISIMKYDENEKSAVLFQYLYVSTDEQNDIVPYISNIFGRDNWTISREDTMNEFKLLFLVKKDTLEEVLLAYRFNVGGYVTSNYFMAKLYQVPAIILKKPYAIFTAIALPCEANCNNVHLWLEGQALAE